MDALAVSYNANGKDLTITADDVRQYICPQATEKEIKLFLELCAAKRMNPYLREAHLIKYGNNPATIVTGKDYFVKTARKQKDFLGFESGVTVVNTDGSVLRRDGSLVLPGEQLVGGWCKVHIDGYVVPMFDEVSFVEYAGTHYDYKKQKQVLNAQWEKMPATMIRKVALVHALREAFPEEFGGMYDSSEMNVEINDEPNIEIVSDDFVDDANTDNYQELHDEYEPEYGTF